MEVKIIAGANFGDEGKGLMTDYFASHAKGKCLVVKANGGSQAGHTVTTPDRERHVFHHFGSGTFAGAATYLAEEFIINPIIFRREMEELKEKGIVPLTFVNRKCRVTTPYDMMLNQRIEENRSSQKHGSCGFGIYETIVRNQKHPQAVAGFAEPSQAPSILKEIQRCYIPKRMKELNLLNHSKEFMDLLYNDNIAENFLDDLQYFYDNCVLTDDHILKNYDTILFECGQGLLLDQHHTAYMPHLTPSSTGAENPAAILKGFKANNMKIEICYVTRTYMTRHGAGRFDTECRQEDIGDSIFDRTNVPNPFQGALRYGYFDGELMIKAIKEDIKRCGLKQDFSVSIAFTHLNETDNMLKSKQGDIPINNYLDALKKQDFYGIPLEKIYLSNGKTREQVLPC